MFDGSHSIPEPMRDLLTIFHEQLGQVRFGDIDFASLQEAAARVEEAAQAYADAEASLQTARLALTATQQTLLNTGQRALAYARIYAEASPELLTRLQTISMATGPANDHQGRDVQTKLARRKARKNAADEMPKLPGTLAQEEAAALSLAP